MKDLDQRLSEWTDHELISPEQAARIADHEASKPRSDRRTVIAEAVGYVGAALALGALGLIVAELWPELRTGGQLALVGLLTVLVAGAGEALHHRPNAAMQRLTGVLWTVTALGAAWFAGIVADDMAGLEPAGVGTVGGAGAALVAIALLVRHPAALLHVVSLGGLVVATTSLLDLLTALPIDVFFDGLLAAGAGGVWLLLGHGGWLAPRRAAETLGGVLVLLGVQVGSFGDLRTTALGLGLLLATGLVVLAITGDASHHLAVGAVGLFVFAPQLVIDVFGDVLGAPAALLLVGLLLVLLAVGLGRARREVGADAHDPAADGPVADEPAADGPDLDTPGSDVTHGAPMTGARASTRGRKPVWLLAAAVLAVAVIAGVLIFGVDRPPQVDPVTADAPYTPPARTAWWTWDDGRDCLYVAETDGTVRELTCADVPGGVVGWTEEGILMQEEPALAEAVIAIDPDTGARSVLERTVEPDYEPDPPEVTEREDGRLILTVEHTPPEPMTPTETRLGRTVLWDVEAPQGYDIGETVPSPDGTAVAIHDSADRLLVVPADGSAEPLLWHADVPLSGLVWEGTQP